MDTSLQVFIRKLIILSLVVVATTFGLGYIVPANFISPSWPIIAAFFFIVSGYVHRFLLKKSDGNQAKFINAFLLTTTIKLLGFLSVIVIYVLVFRDDAVGFILTFFTYYLVYTTFEILSILKYLKK